jgi:hypothetical protein
MSLKTKVKYSNYFYGKVKKLKRKFPSLLFDLENLQQTLLAEPRTGTPLGDNTFKIRLAIKSKGKGKSGGARVISHVKTEMIGVIQNNVVILLTIYDKSEFDSISKEEIEWLIKNMEFE